jgi:hypothetical protein
MSIAYLETLARLAYTLALPASPFSIGGLFLWAYSKDYVARSCHIILSSLGYRYIY